MCSPRLSRFCLASFGERIERTNYVNGLLTTCYKVVELNRLVPTCSNNLLSPCGNLIQQKQHCYNLTRKISHLVASLPTSCVRTARPKLSTSLEQAVNSCDNLVDIVRLVARLFQQVRYSHDITILLQPCVVNVVTFFLYHDCIRLVRTS
jgi:hypothetical protein